MRWDAERYDSAHVPQADAGMELIAMAGVREDDSVLDIGCGTGHLTSELARLAPKGRVVGIDPSGDMLEKARVSLSGGNVSLMRIPAQRMKFSGEFDLVFSNSAFQWIKEQELVAGLVFNALRKNGRVAVQLPAADFCSEMMDNIYGAIAALGLERKFSKMGSPWRFPLKEELAGYLKDAGFTDIDAFYRDYKLVFGSINEVLEWAASAALLPYLSCLSESKGERFKYAFAMGFENYRTGKGIEFGFKRLFGLANKK